ncbi:SpoIIE family protein phosphatase [Streptomyces sp. M54]|uniref:SpoIIE family protein phosphatase n=1 Tax=Streptomyces sp. M54 TaxID=2759525 RepID=UPI001A8F98FB|nr:SpoIIE family protein phosphatase [Streptomyces sp. M54]QSS94402.1 SpoIIE family protein phosphatase [Streptomyces sp. M54]
MFPRRGAGVGDGTGTAAGAVQQELVAVLDRLGVGVFALDGDERIVWANTASLALLSRSAAEVVGRRLVALLHPDAGQIPSPRAAGAGPEATDVAPEGRTWLARGDGSRLPVRWFPLPVESGAGNGARLVAFDTDAYAPGTGDPGRDTDSHGPRPRPAGSPPATRALSERDRLALLADTTAQLVYNIDVDASLRRVVELLLPRLADWAVIDLITETDEVDRSLVVHAHPDGLTVREDLQGPMPPVPASSPMPLSTALRGVASTLAGPSTYDAPPDSAVAVEQRKLFTATGIETAAIAPVKGPSEVLGAITLGRTGDHEPFTPADLDLLEDIGRRMGIALENARHYQRQRRIAATMQRYLLPQLPRLTGVEMTARYLPAPDASHVGGDWYDAFPLPDGDTALVVGDVVGHDLEAAAGMAQLRNMLRAYTWAEDGPPHRTVERLDQAMGHITDVSMATLILARLTADPAGGRALSWTNAGHPPPLLLDPTGATRFLGEGRAILLGAAADHARSDAHIRLPPGSTLLFYTDGLIESRRQPLDVGLRRLREHAAALNHRQLDDFVDQLLEHSRPADNDDDVALLALRIPPTA